MDMDTGELQQLKEELQHLEELLQVRRRNLRQLERNAANHGSIAVPTSLTNQIFNEKSEIEKIEHKRQDVYNSLHYFHNTDNADDTNDFLYQEQQDDAVQTYVQENDLYYQNQEITHHVDWKKIVAACGSAMMFGVAILVTMAVVSSFPQSVISDEFNSSSGLGSWRTAGIVSIVEDGHQDPDSFKGSIGVNTSPTSFAFKKLNQNTKVDQVYSAEVWCKAPVGLTCKVFLGNIQDGLNSPSFDVPNAMSRGGTGNWDSMKISLDVKKEGDIGIFLYAEGNDGMVMYDDLSVTWDK